MGLGDILKRALAGGLAAFGVGEATAAQPKVDIPTATQDTSPDSDLDERLGKYWYEIDQGREELDLSVPIEGLPEIQPYSTDVPESVKNFRDYQTGLNLRGSRAEHERAVAITKDLEVRMHQAYHNVHLALLARDMLDVKRQQIDIIKDLIGLDGMKIANAVAGSLAYANLQLKERIPVYQAELAELKAAQEEFDERTAGEQERNALIGKYRMAAGSYLVITALQDQKSILETALINCRTRATHERKARHFKELKKELEQIPLPEKDPEGLARASQEWAQRQVENLIGFFEGDVHETVFGPYVEKLGDDAEEIDAKKMPAALQLLERARQTHRKTQKDHKTALAASDAYYEDHVAPKEGDEPEVRAPDEVVRKPKRARFPPELREALRELSVLRERSGIPEAMYLPEEPEYMPGNARTEEARAYNNLLVAEARVTRLMNGIELRRASYRLMDCVIRGEVNVDDALAQIREEMDEAWEEYSTSTKEYQRRLRTERTPTEEEKRATSDLHTRAYSARIELHTAQGTEAGLLFYKANPEVATSGNYDFDRRAFLEFDIRRLEELEGLARFGEEAARKDYAKKTKKE